MEDIGRRSALALGLATATALPAVLTPKPAFAQRYGPDEGTEIGPGVRRVDLSERPSEIPAYAIVRMRDQIYEPGAHRESPEMPDDMVCHCLEGELEVSQGPDIHFVARTGDVWSCRKGQPETNVNNGTTAAIMHIILLIPPA